MTVPTARAARGRPPSRPAAVGRLAVRDEGELLEHRRVERRRAQVERRARSRAPLLEVLVELAPRLGRAAGTRRTRGAERARDPLARARGEYEIRQRPRSVAATSSCADRRVVELVRDVDEPLGGGGLAEAAVEIGGDVLTALLLRRRRTPDDVACLAASGDDPSAAPISS